MQGKMSGGGKSVAYKRVSTADQKTNRQLDGLSFDRVFEDKISGSKRNRPALEEMIDYLREGDRLTVHSIDRLARNLRHLLELIELFMREGVCVVFIKENLTFTPDSDGKAEPLQALMLHMMGAFAEFERALTRERQREGIAAGKIRGTVFGRHFRFSPEQREEIAQRLASGESQRSLAQEFKCSRGTIASIGFKAALDQDLD